MGQAGYSGQTVANTWLARYKPDQASGAGSSAEVPYHAIAVLQPQLNLRTCENTAGSHYPDHDEQVSATSAKGNGVYPHGISFN